MNIRHLGQWAANVISDKPALHFLHIGKTGGSSIKHVLSGHRNTGRFRIILHDHKTTLKDIRPGEKVFFCVRDPIERFVSGFYSRQRQGRPTYRARWRKAEKIAFSQFSTPNALGMSLSSRDEMERSRAASAMRSIAHVKSFYRDWLINENYVKERSEDIFFICHQENLTDDFDALVKLLHLPVTLSLPALNSEAAHSNPLKLDKRLDVEAYSNLKKWYEEDYAFLVFLDKTFSGQNFTAKE